MNEIPLGGCATEPLMSYLKALGVLRVVGEQADREARGAWRVGQFVLRSALGESGLAEFFLREYHPTAVVVPWSFEHFFGVREQGHPAPLKKISTPSGPAIIEAFLNTPGERLERYRAAIRTTLEVMRDEGVSAKKVLEDKATKARFLASLRSRASDEIGRASCRERV
jgi:CRISPR-associated protein Csx17